jgi:hypothetical protein
VKILNTYLYSHLAHLDLAKLSDEGIEAMIKDDNIVSINPIIAQAVGGIKILVEEKDYNKALHILQINDFESLKNEFQEDEISEQRKCPRCGSINSFQEGSWLVGLIFLFLMAIPFTTKKSTYACLECSFKWKE